MPVAPGRHLAVLVEVTSRNQLLKRKGYFPARGLARELDRRIREARQGAAEPAEAGERSEDET
jgi:serine kinase of HPr protein (carbohydrate metabolism regulator)